MKKRFNAVGPTVFLLVIAACSCRQKAPTIIEYHPKFYYTGTYVSTEDTRYALTWDSLFVHRPPGSSYVITRKIHCRWKSPDRGEHCYDYRCSWTGSSSGIANKIFLDGTINSLGFDPDRLDGLYFEGRAYFKVEN